MKPGGKYKALLFDVLFKLLVFGILIYLIHGYVFEDQQLLAAFQEFKWIGLTQNAWAFILLFALMPINWFLESYKWSIAMAENGHPISITKSLKAIVVGVTLGMVTPARIGEYAGRSVVVEKTEIAPSLISTLICSLAQNSVNILLGIISLQIFLNSYAFSLNNNLLVGINAIVLLVGLLLYFNIHKVVLRLKSSSYFSKLLKHIPNFQYSPTLLLRVLYLSVMRYAVYMAQFILALRFLNLHAGFLDSVGAIGTIFLIQSSIPIPPVLDLFARSEIAIFILSMLKFNIAGILMASGLLWVINLIMPALLGMIFLLKINVLNTIGYETQ